MRQTFCRQAVSTRCVSPTFASEAPNTESLEAIYEGDVFLSSGEKGRFTNGSDLVAAAMA